MHNPRLIAAYDQQKADLDARVTGLVARWRQEHAEGVSSFESFGRHAAGIVDAEVSQAYLIALVCVMTERLARSDDGR